VQNHQSVWQPLLKADEAYDDLEEEKHLPYAYFEAGFALIDAAFRTSDNASQKCNELQNRMTR